MANLVGQNMGRYKLVEQLGEGGMAAVYKAYDTRLDRYVALKVITPSQQDSAKFLKRFEREAKALASLSHPNIVKVHDYGEENGLPYLVMEYLPGGTLKEKMGRPIPYQEAARILLPISRALEYAHSLQIVHRDIKPANILMTATGEPMLSDFGIAKILKEGNSTELTGFGVGIGTPEYMAPEQGQGLPIDQRADIYALGVVFYELITGRKPFKADTPMAVVFKHITEPLPRPKQFVPNLPDDVEGVIIKMLNKRAEDRFQDMHSMVPVFNRMCQGAPTQQFFSPQGGATMTRVGPPMGTQLYPPTYVPAGPSLAPQSSPVTRQSQRVGITLWLIGGLVTVGIVLVAALAVGGVLWWKYNQSQSTKIAQENPQASQTLRATSTPLSDSTKQQTVTEGSVSQTAKVIVITATTDPIQPSFTPTLTVESSRTPTPTFTLGPSDTPVVPIHIAYVVGDPGSTNIMIADETGGNNQCIACRSTDDQAEPKWSPNGENVVFQANYNGSYDIWIVNIQTGEMSQLTSTNDLDEREPDWSGDNKIVYRASQRDSNRNVVGDLWISDLKGSSSQLGIKGRGPVWSPDGKRIAFMSDATGVWQIYIYDLASKKNRQLTNCTVSCRWPAWSPDGKTIAFNTTTGATSTDPDGVWSIPASGGEMKKVTSNKKPGRPSWSANGWIAFNTSDGIEIIKPDGSKQRVIIAEPAAWAARWSH